MPSAVHPLLLRRGTAGLEGFLFHGLVHHHKFIAASSDRTPLKELPNLACCPADQNVPGAVAQAVVDLLKAVEVEAGHSQPASVGRVPPEAVD